MVRAYDTYVNLLTFRKLTAKLTLLDETDQPLQVNRQVMGDLIYLEFSGRGKYRLILE